MAPVECDICPFPCVKNKRQVALRDLIKILPWSKKVGFRHLNWWFHPDRSLCKVTSSFIISQLSMMRWLQWPRERCLCMNPLYGQKLQNCSSCSNYSENSSPLVRNRPMPWNKCCTGWNFHDQLSMAEQPATSLMQQCVLQWDFVVIRRPW